MRTDSDSESRKKMYPDKCSEETHTGDSRLTLPSHGPVDWAVQVWGLHGGKQSEGRRQQIRMASWEPLGQGCWVTCAKFLYLSRWRAEFLSFATQRVWYRIWRKTGMTNNPYQFLVSFSKAKLCPALLFTQSQPTTSGISHTELKWRHPVFPTSIISLARRGTATVPRPSVTLNCQLACSVWCPHFFLS